MKKNLTLTKISKHTRIFIISPVSFITLFNIFKINIWNRLIHKILKLETGESLNQNIGLNVVLPFVIFRAIMRKDK